MQQHPSSSRSTMAAARVMLALVVLLLAALAAPVASYELVPNPIVTFKHHNYVELTAILQALHKRYEYYTRLFSIGKSGQGRDIWVMEISDEPGIDEALEPNFKYVGNMHGNEVVGREMLLHLIELLLYNYGRDPEVSSLVQNTHIYILPTMNPDGYELAIAGNCYGVHGRGNAKGVDLNRNFPDQFQGYPSVIEPETQVLMNWITSKDFVLSANLHGGALVASYPFDDTSSGESVYSPSPDDAIFRRLAKAYSSKHPTMGKTVCDAEDPKFEDGITNGAAWYSLYGGMQDFNYLHSNCFEITVEMGCCKFPDQSLLPSIWDEHRESLLSYMKQVHTGIKGIIRDTNDYVLVNATIAVDGIKHTIRSNSYGAYFRLLNPGVYKVTVTKAGYEPLTETVVVVENAQTPTILDFTLEHVVGFKYKTKQEISDFLQDQNARFGDIVELRSLERPSPKLNILWYLRITDNSDTEELGEPKVRIVSGSHGIATETALDLIEYLTGHYGKDPVVTNLVDNTDIYIMPLLNPDKYDESLVQRCTGSDVDVTKFMQWVNSAGVDLAHDFPDERGPQSSVFEGGYDPFVLYGPDGEHGADDHIPQPETLALLKFIRNTHFVLGLTLQAGALVASYPFDSLVLSQNVSSLAGGTGTGIGSMDETLFHYLTDDYVKLSPRLRMGTPDGCGHVFPTGTAPGYAWHPEAVHTDDNHLHGMTLQDYSYLHTSSIDVTVALGCCPSPPPVSLEGVWVSNRDALIQFLLNARMGIKGFVENEDGEEIYSAVITISGSNHISVTSVHGEYTKILAPGTYTINVTADGYETQSKQVVIPVPTTKLKNNDGVEFTIPEMVTLDFIMERGWEWGIHEYFEMRDDMIELAEKFPDIAGVYDIGLDVNTDDNNNLWVIEITDHPGHLDFEEPQVALVAGLHGNDAVGRELLLGLARYLCRNYATNERISRILNSTALYILPSANPDGFDNAYEGLCNDTRGEDDERGYDLDRNFPDRIDGPLEDTDTQRETLDLIEWFNEQDFMMTAIFQAGYLGVKYPYDRGDKSDFTGFGLRGSAKTPDDEELKEMARVYASRHPFMTSPDNDNCGRAAFDPIDPGIINGAVLEPKPNSFEDWIYTYSPASFPISIGLGCCKFPNGTDIEQYWDDNIESILAWIEHSHTGLKGIVVDNATDEGLYLARITVLPNRVHPGGRVIESTEHGHYRRLLIPGEYNVTASHDDYWPQTKQVVVKPGSPATELLFRLVHKNMSNPDATANTQVYPAYQFMYHSNYQMRLWMEQQAEKYRNIARLLTIGHSVEGFPLLAMRITQGIGNMARPYHPKVRIVGNIHGNEAVGREIALNMIEHLLFNYGRDSRITRLLETLDVYIVPSLNPDSYNHSRQGQCLEKDTDRYDDNSTAFGLWNVQGVDLYSGFPHVHGDDAIVGTGAAEAYMSTEGRAPEVAAYMDWTLDTRFVLSAVLRSGALVAVYPFDSFASSEHDIAPTDDEVIFEEITRMYANIHHSMHRGDLCSHHKPFANGITNGAAYENITGSIMDWSYKVAGVLESVFYVDCCKFPQHEEQLVIDWEANKEPLLALLSRVEGNAIRGIVYHVNSEDERKALSNVTIEIDGISRVMVTAELGDFWWLLPEGHYNMTFRAERFLPHRLTNVRVNGLTTVTVTLDAVEQVEQEEMFTKNLTILLGVGGAVIALVLALFGYAMYRVYRKYSGFSMLENVDEEAMVGRKRKGKKGKKGKKAGRWGRSKKAANLNEYMFDEDEEAAARKQGGKKKKRKSEATMKMKPKKGFRNEDESDAVEDAGNDAGDGAGEDAGEGDEFEVFNARKSVGKSVQR